MTYYNLYFILILECVTLLLKMLHICGNSPYIIFITTSERDKNMYTNKIKNCNIVDILYYTYKT